MCFTFTHSTLNDATGGLCGECSGQLFPSPSAKTGPAQSKRDSQEPQQPWEPATSTLTQGTKEARIEGAWGVDKGKKDGRADVSRRAQRTVVSSVRLGAGFKALL